VLVLIDCLLFLVNFYRVLSMMGVITLGLWEIVLDHPLKAKMLKKLLRNVVLGDLLIAYLFALKDLIVKFLG